VDDQRLRKFTFDVLLNTKQELLDPLNHLLDLDLGAVRKHCLAEGFLDALNLLHAHNHVFFGG